MVFVYFVNARVLKLGEVVVNATNVDGFKEKLDGVWYVRLSAQARTKQCDYIRSNFLQNLISTFFDSFDIKNLKSTPNPFSPNLCDWVCLCLPGSPTAVCCYGSDSSTPMHLFHNQ